MRLDRRGIINLRTVVVHGQSAGGRTRKATVSQSVSVPELGELYRRLEIERDVCLIFFVDLWYL